MPPLPSESRFWPYPNSPSWHRGGEAARGQVPSPLGSWRAGVEGAGQRAARGARAGHGVAIPPPVLISPQPRFHFSSAQLGSGTGTVWQDAPTGPSPFLLPMDTGQLRSCPCPGSWQLMAVGVVCPPQMMGSSGPPPGCSSPFLPLSASDSRAPMLSLCLPCLCPLWVSSVPGV